MAIRKLLLPLTGTAAGEAALSTCLMIARTWNAHVTALHVRVDSRDVAPLAGEGLSGAMIEEMMSATEKESSERAHAVRSMFDRFVAAARRDPVGGAAGRRCATASFAVGHRPRGGPGRAAGAPRRPDRGAASGCGRGRVVLRRAARRAVRFRPAGADRAADRARDDRHADLPGLERHRRNRPRRCTPRCPGCSAPRRCASCRPRATSGAARQRRISRPIWRCTACTPTS